MRDQDKQELGVWGDLIDVAVKDGHITIDESKLLKIILDNATIYRDVLEQAFEDGELLDEQKEELIKQRKEIINKAYAIANDDQKITEDELSILEKTLEIVKQLELNEKHFSSYWS